MKMRNDIRSQVNADLSKVTWTMHDQYAVLNRTREGGYEPVKKNVSFATALVMAILTIGVTVAFAEMLRLNVFELFGENVDRYKEIAPYTEIEKTSEVAVTTVELGTTVASIENAYYDGQSLMVGYSIQNGFRMDEFTPDDTLIGKMTKVDDVPFAEITTEEEWSLANRWSQAVTNGEPMGIVTYSVYPSDHTTTDGGVDIPPYIEDGRKENDGIEYTIREFEAPLPEELQNLDHLTLNIGLYQGVSYFYFDGTDTFTYYERQVREPMKATVWRTETEFNTLTGHGQYNGLDYEVTAQASAVNVQLELRFEGVLPQLPDDDHWYEFHLTDESGRALRSSEYDTAEPGTVRVLYEGTGKAPTELTLRMYIAHEGDFDEAKAMEDAQPVVLTQEKE